MAHSALTTGPIVLNMGSSTNLLSADSNHRRLITLGTVNNKGGNFISVAFFMAGQQIGQMTVPPGETRLAPITGHALGYGASLTASASGGAVGDAAAVLTYDTFHKSE